MAQGFEFEISLIDVVWICNPTYINWLVYLTYLNTFYPFCDWLNPLQMIGALNQKWRFVSNARNDCFVDFETPTSLSN
jgi:hypothetical protein